MKDMGTSSGVETSIELPCAANPRASVIIPTASQADMLSRCLRSLASNVSQAMPYEVIVVLNAATDEVRDLVLHHTNGVRVIDSPANLGVAGGYNRGRSVALGQYVVLIHDDTEIQPQWLEMLVETADLRPEAGAVSSMVLYPDGKLQGVGAILWKEGMTSQAWGTGEAIPEDFTTTRPVDYAGTSSILVRADTWDIMGGLDEQLYPAYFVDVDLCMTVRKHGQIVLCDPRARVFHHRGSSSSLSFRSFMAMRNHAYFLEKWREDLQGYEPHDPQDEHAVQRARDHTQRLADLIAARWTVAPVAQVTPRLFDPAAQDARHLHKERELNSAYRAEMESRCVTLERHSAHVSNELVRVTQALMTANEKLEAKKSELQELKKKCAGLRDQLNCIRKKQMKKRIGKLVRGIARLWRPDSKDSN